MNTNLITISNILPQTNLPNTNFSKVDAINKNEKFTFELDNEAQNLRAQESVTTNNEAELKPLNENQQPMEKEEDFQNTQEIKNNAEPDKEVIKANTDENPSEIEDKSSEGSFAREDDVNTEPKSVYQLDELLAAFKENTNLSVNTQISQSPEIQELLQSSDEINQNIKSVLLGKSQDLISLNKEIGSEFVASIKDKIDGKVADIEELDLNNRLINITGQVQKNAEQAKAETILSDKDFIAQVRNNRSDIGKQIEITGQKDALLENIVNNQSKINSADEKISMFDGNNPSAKAEAANIQQKIEQNVLQKQLLNNERLTNDKAGENKEFDISQIAKESILRANGLNGNSDIHKLNVISIQSSTDEKEGQSSSTANINMDSKASIAYSTDSSQTGTMEQILFSNENVKAGNYMRQSSANDASANVGKQIFESIQSSLANPAGDKQVTVRLNPPELGKVFIKFQEQENQITGFLEASKTQTRIEIEQALPQIIRNLSDSGINIKKLEVVLTSGENQEQEILKDNLFYNGEQYQHDSGNPTMYESEYDMGGIHDWMASNISHESNSGLQDAIAVDNSINILI
jgi:flagellar hook-length control protein FliK